MSVLERTEPPPGFEWHSVLNEDGTSSVDRGSVVATEPLIEWAMSLRHSFIEGPRLRFTLEFAWKWRDQMLLLLGGVP